MNIIVSIQGGIGKSVFSTAFLKATRKQYPNAKIIVLTGYPEVFSNNPIVDMVFNHGQETYFYQKYIENQEVMVFANEPYLVTEHIQQKEHIIQTLCRMNQVPYNGEIPEIYINEREFQFYHNKYQAEKPIMILQTNGGGQQDIKYSWARDMPRNVANAVIEEFKSQYTIYHIRREDQLSYNHVIPIHESFKGIACLIARSEKRVLIDSFCQHTAFALGKKSTVLWIANSPRVFGYSLHDNILANPENGKGDLKFSLFSKYTITGMLNEFPYLSENDIFDVHRVIESIKNQ
jgi:hypothetical protein